MIIARTKEDITRIVDYFVNEGFAGPTVRINNKCVSLTYWLDCMIEELEKKGLLIFEPIWQWDNQENRIEKYLRWFSPVTLDEYLTE